MVGSASLTSPGRRPSPWLAPLVFAASALAFLPALRNGWVWDDFGFIVHTLGFRGLDSRHLRWIFTTMHLGNFTPLSWLSYALDYSIWRLNPAGYHLTNLLIHALNAALFYLLSRLLLGLAFSSPESSSEIEFGALFASLAFALSPLRVESVAWAAERRDVLAGFFYLATLLFYCRAVLDRGARSSRLRLLSLAAYACAALSKPSVVPLPAALLALDYYPLRRLDAGKSAAQIRAVLLEKLPYAAMALACAAMTVRAQVLSNNLVAVSQYGMSDRFIQAFYGLGFYVRMTALPSGLSPLYPLAEGRGPLLLHALGSAAALAAAVLTLWAAGVPRKAQAALWGYYAALLLPVLGIVQNGAQTVALRYSYLACLGWALLAGAAAAAALRDRAGAPRWSRAVLACLILWLAGNAWSAQTQIAAWHDGRSLWESVARRYPTSPDANINLADALLAANEPGQALAYADAAVRLLPPQTSQRRTARLARARALAALGRAEEARAELSRDLDDDPDWGDGRALLGVVLGETGRAAESEDQLRRAAALLPGSAEAQANAGASLAMRGRFAEALPYFERAALIEPENPAYAALVARARADAAHPPASAR